MRRRIFRKIVTSSVLCALVFSFIPAHSQAAVSSLSWNGHLAVSETNTWQSVAWSPKLSLFVAVAATGTNLIMTSTDGSSWTSLGTGVWEGCHWDDVIWAASAPNGLGGTGLFVSTSGSGSGCTTHPIMTSPDGTTWTIQTNPVPTNTWPSVTWSPQLNLFVAVSDKGGTGINSVMTSPDGVTWTACASARDANRWQSVTWAATAPNGLGGWGLFVAVAGSAVSGATITRAMTSPDGVTWTGQTTSNDANAWWGVTWSPQLGLFVAVAANGDTNRSMTSPDGVTWTAHATPGSNSQWQRIVWSPELGVFVSISQAVVAANTIMISSNGTTWTAEASSSDTNWWRGLTWSPDLGIFVGVSTSGGGSTNLVTASTPITPTISSISSGTPTATGATITWTTDTEASSQVNYGLTTGYGSSTSLDSTLVFSHSQTITGLTCNTTYDYDVVSTYLTTATSGNNTFTTATCPSAPTVTTSAPSSITTSGVTLGGSVTATGGANASARGFNYGLTTSYGTTTIESGSFSTGAFTATLTGLSCGTTYHFQAYATNTSGTGTSSDDTFTTSACPAEYSRTHQSVYTCTQNWNEWHRRHAAPAIPQYTRIHGLHIWGGFARF